jgi:hypothetical protein
VPFKQDFERGILSCAKDSIGAPPPKLGINIEGGIPPRPRDEGLEDTDNGTRNFVVLEGAEPVEEALCYRERPRPHLFLNEVDKAAEKRLFSEPDQVSSPFRADSVREWSSP